MKKNRIRPLAICVFRNRGRILVNESHDPVKDEYFFRPLGGGIESIIAGAWTGRIEYRYAQYSDFNALLMPTNCCDGNLNTTISLSTHTFIAGIAYKLGGY